MVGGQRHTPATVLPGKRPGTHRTVPLLLLGPAMADGKMGCGGKFNIR